jgi:hypothetical protein
MINLPLMMRRSEVIAELESRGLRNREARAALEMIPKVKHRLHDQARWWRAEVEQFDTLAFLNRLHEDGDGKQGNPGHADGVAAPYPDLP